MIKVIDEINGGSNDDFLLVRDAASSNFLSFIESFKKSFGERIDTQSFTEDDYKLFLDKSIEAMPYMTLTSLKLIRETGAILFLSIICKRFNVRYKDAGTFSEEIGTAIMEAALPDDQAVLENSAYIVDFLDASRTGWLLPMIYKVEDAIRTLFITADDTRKLSLLRDASRKVVEIELGLVNDFPEA